MAKYDIFISYRREGGYDTAKHLYDLLTRDGYNVSFDIDTLRYGDFDKSLLSRIDSCSDFILIIDAHAFDRTLDPNFSPNNDWLRQELAYALKKGKNIIPIFLNGVKGFPNDLPPDIAKVSKKNGPEYNRYYFNDFYDRLKSDFITSKSHKRIWRFIILITLFSLIAVSIFTLAKNGNITTNETEVSDSINIVSPYSKITEYKPNREAKKLFIDIAGITPIYAATYMEDVPILVGLINNNVLEGEMPDTKFIAYPDLSLIRYHEENGVWQHDFTKKIQLDKIIDLDDGAPFCLLDDDYELYTASQQPYLFFHMIRTCNGNASADIYNDFIVINLIKGSYHFIEYLENIDSHYTDNGSLYKESHYPKGIEDLLLKKFSETDDIQKVNISVTNESDEHVTDAVANGIETDVKNCFKQWNADNPKRPDIDDRLITAEPGPEYQKAYKEYIKNNYGKNHARTAVVRMYRDCPILPTGEAINNPNINTMTIQDNDYIVYSVWRGPVVAMSKKNGCWFVVWDEDYHYNTKYISSLGNGEIKMEYVDASDINHNTEVIYYNLNTHKYYFTKEQRSNNIF